MITAGQFKALAIDAVMSETKDGNPQIAVLFKLQEGPDMGACLTWYGYFTEKALPICIKGLRAAGWTGSDLCELGSLKPSTKECSVAIKHETYEGETKARIAFVNESIGIAVTKPMDAGKTKSFAEQMRARIMAAEAGKGNPEDVPF